MVSIAVMQLKKILPKFMLLNQIQLLWKSLKRKKKVSVIGNGTVIDLQILVQEIKSLRRLGFPVTNKNLKISSLANIILPYHKSIEKGRENLKGKNAIGTTGRGIGPTYEDKVGRRSIRVMDLRSEKNLDQRLEVVLLHHNAIRKGLGKQIFEKDQLKNTEQVKFFKEKASEKNSNYENNFKIRSFSDLVLMAGKDKDIE